VKHLACEKGHCTNQKKPPLHLQSSDKQGAQRYRQPDHQERIQRMKEFKHLLLQDVFFSPKRTYH
jgi:hypothetical protein